MLEDEGRTGGLFGGLDGSCDLKEHGRGGRWLIEVCEKPGFQRVSYCTRTGEMEKDGGEDEAEGGHG